MKNEKKQPTHIDEADHLRLQLVNARQQIAALEMEIVQVRMSAKYGEGVSYDPASLEIKRPSAEPNPSK